MPKIKTNRSAAKRFKKTGGSGLKRERAYASHLLSSKSRGRKRRLRKGTSVSSADLRRAKRLLGLG
ncbi:MAG: 50S ribosomal protein L35 [Candidatus Eisenbacteria sp.]|nr:50S ribosomal protein L35 [Candidatus Eisenbacteria bacterium]